MVTPLDITLLRQFDFIFPFLFVITILYAVLIRMEFFKDNKTWVALIAFALAMMTAFSDIAVTTINYMAPWIVLVIIMLVMLLLSVAALGPTHEDMMSVLKHRDYDYIWYIILGVVLVIGFGSFAKAVSEAGGFGVPADATTQEVAFYATMFHPQILGMILIMIIAFFTIMRLTTKPR